MWKQKKNSLKSDYKNMFLPLVLILSRVQWEMNSVLKTIAAQALRASAKTHI